MTDKTDLVGLPLADLEALVERDGRGGNGLY